MLYEIIYFSILSFTSVTVGLALLMFKARTFESLLEQSFIELIFTTMGHPCKCVFVSSYSIEDFNGISHSHLLSSSLGYFQLNEIHQSSPIIEDEQFGGSKSSKFTVIC